MSGDRLDCTVFVTGGAGFIGSTLVRKLVREGASRVVAIDALTYAGSLASLAPVAKLPNFVFEHVDITDAAAVERCFTQYSPELVFHLAAESHVDRSIDAPAAFIGTNVIGTYVLLEAALRQWRGAPNSIGRHRFIHVSTDEVFGSLGREGYFIESTPYDPRSPYSATKAASDHLARAWYHTFGLPVIVTNCSNNYGPYQFPEKLIPVVIRAALAGKAIPIYGRGANVRDWIFVDDHVDALSLIARTGQTGRTYAIGASSERTNLEVVSGICGILDAICPDPVGSYNRLITFVADRPGHDLRYAIDSTRVRSELGWFPRHTFEEGLLETVRWYVNNDSWCLEVMANAYRGERLGLGVKT